VALDLSLVRRKFSFNPGQRMTIFSLPFPFSFFSLPTCDVPAVLSTGSTAPSDETLQLR